MIGRPWEETKWTWKGTRARRYRYKRWREWDRKKRKVVIRSVYLGLAV